MTKNNAVNGVKLNNGDTLFSDKIILNMSPISAMSILDNSGLNLEDRKKKYIKKIDNIKLSVSALHLYIALDTTLGHLGVKHNTILVFEDFSHEKNYSFMEKEEYKKYFFYITNYSNSDRTMAPNGCSVLNIMTLELYRNWSTLSAEQYKIKKQRVSNIFIKRINKLIPDIKKHIIHSELATPLTMQRYTGHPEGCIYGGEQSNKQSGINRLSNITPIKGLYLSGAYTYPGAGYSSVIYSGYKAYKASLD